MIDLASLSHRHFGCIVADPPWSSEIIARFVIPDRVLTYDPKPLLMAPEDE